jgi:ribulose-phosphate 3-epimerase
MEHVAPFAKRLHIDVADGEFAPRLISLSQVWWPVGVIADFHIMHQHPWREWETIISHRPQLVIVHAEADLEDFVVRIAELHQLGIAIGLAFLKPTPVTAIDPNLIALVDHALIFSGDLGHFGGDADLNLLDKILELKAINPRLEFGWDGGANKKNVAKLAKGGVNVITSGGFIHKAKDPLHAYIELAHRCM